MSANGASKPKISSCQRSFPAIFPTLGRLRYPRITALAFSAAAVIALFADFAPETTSLTPIIEAFRFATRGNAGPSLSPRGGRFFGRTSGPRLLAERTSLRHLESRFCCVPFRGLRRGPTAPIARGVSALEDDMRFSFVELEFHGCAKMEH